MADKKIWYYKKEGIKEGPVSRKQLEKMLLTGEIEETTKVWTGSLPSWVAISEVEHFNLSTLDETPAVELSKPVEYERETDEEFARPHPWIRFWARMVDYSLFMLFLIFIIAQFQFVVFPIHAAFSMLILFMWVFIETLLLVSWGTTPGKWLLNIKVRDQFNHKLVFSEALNRSFSVWWLGMGAGVPIVFLITMIVAAVKLSNTGTTSWDRRSHYKILHGSVGWARTLITILYFLAFFWLLFWGQFELYRMK